MKTKERLIELRDLYSKRMETARKNTDKFTGAGQQEWSIQFYMARGKVEVLDYLIKEEKNEQ